MRVTLIRHDENGSVHFAHLRMRGWRGTTERTAYSRDGVYWRWLDDGDSCYPYHSRIEALIDADNVRRELENSKEINNGPV